MDFAGWEMPVQYPLGVRGEHMAVRERCGIFDVSHMGEIEVSGSQARELLQSLLSNDVSQIRVGGSQYSVLCDERGGVLDDLFTYQVEPDRYLTVTNASNHEPDLAWFRARADAAGLDAHVRDRIDDYAMLAVQGPLAREIVQAISDTPLPARMTAATRRLSGAEVLVCGTGYTGEEGVELLAVAGGRPRAVGRAVPSRRHARGPRRARHAAPGGLLSPVRPRAHAPAQPNRSRPWLVLSRGHRLRRLRGDPGPSRQSGPQEKLVAFMLDGPGIARQGNPVIGGGEVTSGTLSPCLDAGIGLAYVPAERSAVGTPIQIDVRGRVRAAPVHSMPFVAKKA